MKLTPNNLRISLERKDRLGFWTIAACVLVIFISAFISPPFATVFAASTIVGLPVLWLLILSPKGTNLFASWGDLGRIAFYLLLFSYIALAKSVLVPVVMAVIQHALA
ncbi:hypothetical protein [Thiobacillus sedimenti]|uniref:Uncharacterized protein n=1 Tax=Thiobacillus sedimenti TaxID=3110231 RepID=A0ABZ1CNJ1_9PROT|nr:hypothetical protein [Thiobacillus sp. SCUT-2]WRS40465.1 hypothetical protein VA613_06205 [Thiobacillus sp. SCUT-2]